jgi:hypothetical protein
MVKVRPLGQIADRLVEPLVTALADALDGAPATECAVEATAEIVPVTHPQPFQADIVLARG